LAYCLLLSSWVDIAFAPTFENESRGRRPALWCGRLARCRAGIPSLRSGQALPARA